MIRMLALGAMSLFLALSLAACSPAPVVTRPAVVTVTKTQYKPIPKALLQHCKKVSDSTLKTNGDLLDAKHVDDAQIDICNGRLDAIRDLKPPG